MACEKILVKPVWSQMKQNAGTGAKSGRSLAQFAASLASLRAGITNLEVHFIGHSAGSIVLGKLLTLLGKKNVTVDSVELNAPACTFKFANRHYANAMKNRTLAKKSFQCHVISDPRKQDDSIGPYGKSLLYLVSRTLEEGPQDAVVGKGIRLAELRWLGKHMER